MAAIQNFQDLFSLDIPLIQAPMAGTSSPKLAAEVCNAGAIGSLGLGAMTLDNMEKAALEIQQRTTKPYNLNFFCHQRKTMSQKMEKNWL